MNKKAIISVVSKQKGSEEDIIEVVTPGKYYKRNEKYYAVYEESELSGMKGTTTTLKIEKEKFTILRKGTVNAKMVFENKGRDHVLYSTPHGSLGLSLDIIKVNIDINEDGGDIYANYNLNLGQGQVLPTEIKVNIEAREELS